MPKTDKQIENLKWCKDFQSARDALIRDAEHLRCRMVNGWITEKEFDELVADNLERLESMKIRLEWPEQFPGRARAMSIETPVHEPQMKPCADVVELDLF